MVRNATIAGRGSESARRSPQQPVRCVYSWWESREGLKAVWLLPFSEVPVPFLSYSCEEGVGALGLCIPEPNQQMGTTTPSSGMADHP